MSNFQGEHVSVTQASGTKNTFLFVSDEDLSGDHLLAETKFSIHKAIAQASNKKFQLPLERPNLKVCNSVLFSIEYLHTNWGPN